MTHKPEQVEFQFTLGSRVRDRVSLVEGVVDMRAQYLNGCIRYSVQPQSDKPNPDKMPSSYWIDEGQIELVDEGLNLEESVIQTPTGGPTECSNSARM